MINDKSKRKAILPIVRQLRMHTGIFIYMFIVITQKYILL